MSIIASRGGVSLAIPSALRDLQPLQPHICASCASFKLSSQSHSQVDFQVCFVCSRFSCVLLTSFQMPSRTNSASSRASPRGAPSRTNSASSNDGAGTEVSWNLAPLTPFRAEDFAPGSTITHRIHGVRKVKSHCSSAASSPRIPTPDQGLHVFSKVGGKDAPTFRPVKMPVGFKGGVWTCESSPRSSIASLPPSRTGSAGSVFFSEPPSRVTSAGTSEVSSLLSLDPPYGLLELERVNFDSTPGISSSSSGRSSARSGRSSALSGRSSVSSSRSSNSPVGVVTRSMVALRLQKR